MVSIPKRYWAVKWTRVSLLPLLLASTRITNQSSSISNRKTANLSECHPHKSK